MMRLRLQMHGPLLVRGSLNRRFSPLNSFQLRIGTLVWSNLGIGF
jgi:hypothetical protein